LGFDQIELPFPLLTYLQQTLEGAHSYLDIAERLSQIVDEIAKEGIGGRQ
jgi:hypothetical protein